MNILTQEERETALRCIAQGGRQADEASADGKRLTPAGRVIVEAPIGA